MSALAANNSADDVVVLVVEDENLVRFDLVECLEAAGFVVIEAGSGEAAIALCGEGTSIDLVITDINLGGPASGWDVAECFRATRPEVLVIYTSGKLMDPGRRVSGSVFVSKPYQSRDILKVCQRLAPGLDGLSAISL